MYRKKKHNIKEKANFLKNKIKNTVDMHQGRLGVAGGKSREGVC
jgi:hypothetical protein